VSRLLAVAVGATHLALCACAAPTLEPEQHALLMSPGAEVREELRRAVSDAFHGAPVVLADDALTTTSELIVERTPVRDASGRILGGRDEDRPQHFHLLSASGACILVHDASGRRTVLQTAHCGPAP